MTIFRKRALSLMLTICMVLGLLPALTLPARAAWDGTSIDTTWYGDGTANDFTISTEAELAGLAALVNGTAPDGSGGTLAAVDFAGDTITLDADLDLGGKDWTPIGTGTKTFRGSFDGDRHTISDLAIGTAGSPSALSHVGLFGIIGTSAAIKNLSVAGAVYGGDSARVGGLVGDILSGSSIINCHSAVAATGGKDYYVGGLVGISYGSITSCSATGAAAGDALAKVGGLVGRLETGSTVTNCYATGAAAGGDYAFVGGLVGNVGSNSNITNCYATGDAVGGAWAKVGGLAGASGGTVVNSYATGDATGGANGSTNVGGLVGYIFSGSATNCYATGAVTGGDGAYIGGLVGVNSGTVANGYWNRDAAQTVGSPAVAQDPKLGIGNKADSNPGGANDGPGQPTTAMLLADMKMQAFADKLNAGINATDMTAAQMTAVGDWRWALAAEGETPAPSLFYDGTGDGRSEATPYVIRTEAQLRVLAQLVSEGKSFVGEHFALANDLALTGEWTPIGLGIRIFRGIFDGGGHTISDLAIGTADSPSAFPYVGLFGSMGNQGTIKNLGVAGAVYGGDGANVGGLAGITTPDSTIVNCYVAGTVSGGVGANVGGLVGSLNGGSATNCYATGAVTGGDGANIGGLVGYLNGSSATNCYATGAVTGGDNAQVGGFVGLNSVGTVANGYWNADAAQALGGVGSGADGSSPKTSAEMKLAPFMTLLQDFVTANPTVGVWNKESLSDWAQDAKKNGGMPYLADVVPADDPPIIPPSGGGSVGVTTPPVTVTKPENGTVTVNPTNPKKGGTVTVTVKPDAGYETDGITVKDRDGNTLPVTDNGDGSYSFIYGGSPVTVTASFVSEAWQNPFTDVKVGDWFYGDVRHVYGNGLMTGISQDEFGPGLPMSRAMLVTVLYRMAGEPGVEGPGNPFSDVEGGQWYTNAVIWAAKSGITVGYGDGTFGTDDEITREDMCVMLVRFMELMGIELPALREARDFGDMDDISDYAKDAVMALYQAGIIEGRGGGIFDPQGEATRAELAALLHRFLVAAGLETK
ncbi:S-layer homology domain-containing protein [Oscillospiraceae bacterium OttesenSCG-928-F05]|nr:S-layer homology domain-containing protein [Oscillospiraceae bacterium OttesenSCG-928-F05]